MNGMFRSGESSLLGNGGSLLYSACSGCSHRIIMGTGLARPEGDLASKLVDISSRCITGIRVIISPHATFRVRLLRRALSPRDSAFFLTRFPALQSNWLMLASGSTMFSAVLCLLFGLENESSLLGCGGLFFLQLRPRRLMYPGLEAIKCRECFAGPKKMCCPLALLPQALTFVDAGVRYTNAMLQRPRSSAPGESTTGGGGRGRFGPAAEIQERTLGDQLKVRLVSRRGKALVRSARNPF